MILSRGQNKVLHQHPVFCYQHCCPTLSWAIRVTGWRICQRSGKGDLNTWLLLIRTWNHSEYDCTRLMATQCTPILQFCHTTILQLSNTPTTKPVWWEGLPYIFPCGCCQQAEISISCTANLADFTETLLKTSPELKSYCLCLPLQGKEGQPHSASGQNLFPTASKMHTDSIQRSAAMVFDEECAAFERQCCHCDPLSLLRAISPLFPLKMRKGLRSLKWKLPLIPNHPEA